MISGGKIIYTSSVDGSADSTEPPTPAPVDDSVQRSRRWVPEDDLIVPGSSAVPSTDGGKDVVISGGTVYVSGKGTVVITGNSLVDGKYI